MEKNNNYKNKFWFGIVFFVFVFSYFISIIIRSEHTKSKLYDKYPPLLRVDKLENYVTEKYEKQNDMLRHSSGIAFVTLNNNTKYRIWAESNEESNMGINEFLKVGDLISKKPDNDSIYIVKQYDTLKIKHLFVLINE